jgi:hypothetical protein
MTYNCNISIDIDSDRPKFSVLKEIKARKQHKCGECNRIIEIGEVYENYFGVYDNNDTLYHKTCNDCLVIRDVFYGNSSYFYGEIFSYIHESYNGLDTIPESCLSELTQRGKDYFFNKIEEEWEEEE